MTGWHKYKKYSFINSLADYTEYVGESSIPKIISIKSVPRGTI